MKKFILYILTNLTFKKMVLPIIIRLLKVVFSERQIIFLLKHFSFIFGIFRTMNALLGFLLFINIFDFTNIFSILGIFNAIVTFFRMIFDNFFKVINKLLAPSPVININIEKLESVKRLNDFSRETSNKYESLRELYNKPIMISEPESIFKSYLYYIAGLLLLMLLGFGIFKFFGGGSTDFKGKSVDRSHLGDVFTTPEPRITTPSLLGSIRSILSERSHYFRSPGNSDSPTKSAGNTTQLMDSPSTSQLTETPVLKEQVSMFSNVLRWFGLGKDRPFVPGEGVPIPVFESGIEHKDIELTDVTSNIQSNIVEDVVEQVLPSDPTVPRLDHSLYVDPYAKIRAELIGGVSNNNSSPNTLLSDVELDILYSNFENKYEVLLDNQSTIIYSDSSSTSSTPHPLSNILDDDITPYDL
uniref:hypothetical protein n=1 Tax=Ganoderma sichuanense TaxID=1173713 RepID=UPI001BF097E1|nr:hypothetical protein MFP96_mgp31 [Ganoderma sichuanense]QUA00741.1 hypothetical protein [Ganoderma sichuanense]